MYHTTVFGRPAVEVGFAYVFHSFLETRAWIRVSTRRSRLQGQEDRQGQERGTLKAYKKNIGGASLRQTPSPALFNPEHGGGRAPVIVYFVFFQSRDRFHFHLARIEFNPPRTLFFIFGPHDSGVLRI